MALYPAPAASVSVLFWYSSEHFVFVCFCVCASVLLFCFADVHQIKAAEHHN